MHWVQCLVGNYFRHPVFRVTAVKVGVRHATFAFCQEGVAGQEPGVSGRFILHIAAFSQVAESCFLGFRAEFLHFSSTERCLEKL